MLCYTVTDAVLHNVALNKRSYQSSTYTNQFGTHGASLANDGNMNSCVRSQSQNNPWWAVDLGVETLVAQVNLTNSGDAAGRPPEIYFTSFCLINFIHMYYMNLKTHNILFIIESCN